MQMLSVIEENVKKKEVIHLHVIINNFKVVGIFFAICLISLPITTFFWNQLEYMGNAVLTYTVTFLYTIVMIFLYFVCGRFFIKSIGNLFYDALSFIAIIIIYIFVIPNYSTIVFSPFIFFIIVIRNTNFGMIIASLISMMAVFIGIVNNH